MSYVIVDEGMMVRQRRTRIVDAFSKNNWETVTEANRPAENRAFREVTRKTVLSQKIKFDLYAWEYELKPYLKPPKFSDFLWRVYLTELEVMRRGSNNPMGDVADREYLRPSEAKYILELVSLIMEVRDMLNLEPLPPIPTNQQKRYNLIKAGIVQFHVLQRHTAPKKFAKKKAA
jgi:hypothetical protein